MDDFNVVTYVRSCMECNKEINLNNQEDRDNSFYDDIEKKWWCTDCFEYMDWSILFDESMELKEKETCYVCKKIYYTDSVDYYRNKRKCRTLINYPNICSQSCLKSLFYGVFPNKIKKCKICNNNFETKSLKCCDHHLLNELLIYDTICSSQCLNIKYNG